MEATLPSRRRRRISGWLGVIRRMAKRSNNWGLDKTAPSLLLVHRLTELTADETGDEIKCASAHISPFRNCTRKISTHGPASADNRVRFPIMGQRNRSGCLYFMTILITGAGGQLGQTLLATAPQGTTCSGRTSAALDIAGPDLTAQ